MPGQHRIKKNAIRSFFVLYVSLFYLILLIVTARSSFDKTMYLSCNRMRQEVVVTQLINVEFMRQVFVSRTAEGEHNFRNTVFFMCLNFTVG